MTDTFPVLLPRQPTTCAPFLPTWAGQYEIASHGPTGPAFTIKGKPKEQQPESASVPGPGAYQAEARYD
jgi:hypothetical protein